MIDASLSELSSALAQKRISSVELTRLFLDRAQRLNPLLNAFITLDCDTSLSQAREADVRRERGEAQPLTGIPVALKDIFCAKGWLTTCGSKILSNFVSPYDAHVVERLRAAGAINLGKTNMDEFAMGSSSETSFYGPVKNPWDPTVVPGGSSGGSACAVAARMAPAALGTDTGGSIRQPAAMCGISGLKPTYGLVSRYGMVAFASSLDQGGPMARSAGDLALILNAIAGFDPRDSTCIDRPGEDYTRLLNEPLAGLRIGLPKEYFSTGLASDVGRVVAAAIDQYTKLGCKVIDISLPQTRLAVPAYYVLAPAEASSNLARFDGVRYGYRA
ncbi:MAG: Asp-tRNA(Asn)/Glu-tRNA(Gln) amidotransferase subunit GatA, partial [Proteobacteria bacterium]